MSKGCKGGRLIYDDPSVTMCSDCAKKESKTPRTDAETVHDSWHGDYVPSFFARQLETELSEANRRLAQAEETADHFNGKANDFYAELLKARNQLEFIQDQIQSGELVPLDKCTDLVAEYEGYWKALPYGREEGALTFQQFASELARKAGGE